MTEALIPAPSQISLTRDEVRRYSRHLIIPDIGVNGQQRLKDARVLCIGAGGLGSPALLYLAAAGVGTIGIIDGDHVDESNLQRQIIHGSPIDHVTAGQRNRAQAILQRRTDRLPFDSPMYWHLFEPALRDAVDKDVAMLDVVSDDQRTRLVVASQLSEVLRRDDPYYHAELEWWTSPFVLAHGVPPDTLASDAERLRVDLGRDFPVRSYQNRRAELADDRSKVLVLSTPSDTRADALRCGEVLSTILLECTMAGMATCTLTHLIESSDSRDIVRGLTRQRGEPQALIRVGIAPPLAAVPAPTPRRPLDSVLQIRQTPEKGRNASDRNARETGWFSPP